jgi:Zn-dependent M28 family amino/carboxypeptidase
MQRTPFKLLFRLIAGFLLTLPAAAPLRADPAITAGEVISHVRYLASDELAGRGSGTPGGRMAAEYVARHFRTFGLRPAGADGSFLQSFPVVVGVRLHGENALEVSAPRGTAPRLQVERDFLPVAFSASGKASGPVVFAGYGISQPEMKHDDYAGLDANGKIVVVLRRAPEGGEHGRFGQYASLRYKATAARDHGAAGVVFITGPETSSEEDVGKLESDGSFADSGIPAVIARRKVVEALLASMDRRLAPVQKALDRGEVQSFAIPGSRASLQVGLKREERETANVVGMLEGSEPALKDEAVVVGAHYDHLGMGGPGSLYGKNEPAIHHGADDNASGTAGVMELAEYFAANRSRLQRTVVFIAFSGEEMGLLGSAYYVRHPVVPLERTVAMINMDMIGREKNNTVHILGTKTSTAWPALLEAVNAHAHLNVRMGASGFGDSDQSSFYGRNIPVLFFFTGTHEDYHRPSDTWEKINAEGEAQILRFVAEVLERISAMPQRPQFVRSDEPTAAAGPGFNVYVGSVPDYSETTSGVTLTGVREGSPAEKAGLKPGDVIVEFGGKKITNVYDYTFALRDAKAGVPVEVVVLRGGSRLRLKVTPAVRR